MDTSLDYYYKVNRLASMLIGVWPYYESKIILYVRITIIGIMTIMCISEYGVFFNPSDSYSTMSLFFEMVPINLVTTLLLGALVNIYYNEASHKALWDDMQNSWFSLNEEVDIEFKRTFAKIGRKVTIIAYCLYVMGIMSFFILTFSSVFFDFLISTNESRSRQFPFKFELFIIDKEKYFFLVLLAIFGSVSLVAFVGTTIQCLFWVQMLHLIGLIKLTGYRLEELLYDKSDDIQYIDEIYTRSIIIFIQRHQQVLRFRERMETYWNFIISILVLLFVFSTTLSLVQLSSGSDDYKPFFQICLIFISASTNNSIVQYMTNSSSEIINKLYFSEWYRVSPTVRKLLPIIMQQSHRTCTINVLKIVNLSLITLREIVRLSMSYYTVMKNLK